MAFVLSTGLNRPALRRERLCGKERTMSIDAIDLARRLVAIPSESSQSNVPVLDELSGTLESAGFTLTRYDQRVFDAGSGPKANLVAERGSGRRRLVFSGHVDTVPVGDPDLWDQDPYGGDGIVDGKLHGRGSVDMKGQVAAMAAACSLAEAELDDLTLVLAITADEETGHQGIKSLTADHVFEDAVGAVVGEPTILDVLHAHKGAQTLSVDLHGVNCHSSQPGLGVNAIDQAIRLVNTLESRMADWRAFRHPAFREEGPTFSVVKIGGGVAHNVVPDHCNVRINVRGLLWGNLESFRSELGQVIGELRARDEAEGMAEERRFAADVTTLIMAPPMLTPTDDPWYRAMASHTGQEQPLFARYGTDGGVLSQVGMPCVVRGPGDIRRAHTPNEFITVEELRDGVLRYSGLIQHVAGANLPTVTTRLWDRPIRPV